MKRLGLALAFALAAAPAQAQRGSLERLINTSFHRCQWSAAPIYSPKGKIQDCQPSIRALEALRDSAKLEPADSAHIQYNLVIAHTIIAGAHKIVGEEAAACARYERAWVEAVRLDPPADDPNSGLMHGMRNDAAANARKCREAYPKSEGAPDLPPLNGAAALG